MGSPTPEDLSFFKEFISEIGHTDDGETYRMALIGHALLAQVSSLRAELEEARRQRDDALFHQRNYQAGLTAARADANRMREALEKIAKEDRHQRPMGGGFWGTVDGPCAKIARAALSPTIPTDDGG